MDDADSYDASETRVASWLSEKGVGGGSDPIGFMIASQEHMATEIKRLKADLNDLLSVSSRTCGQNNCNCPGAKNVKDVVKSIMDRK